MKSYDYFTLETLAQAICLVCGGNWEARKHKRNHWRKRAAAVMDKAGNADFITWWTKAARALHE